MSNGLAIPSFGDLPQDQQDEILRECQSEECLEATNALARARNDVVEKCENWKYLDGQVLKRWAVVAMLAAAAAAVAAAGGFLLGIPEPTLVTKVVAAVLLVAAGVLAVIALVLAAMAGIAMSRAAEARSDLQDARDAFDEAVINVQAACGLYCMPDLDEPLCA